MTGGGRGFCGSDAAYAGRGRGRRIGRGGRYGRRMGAGRGWGASPFPTGGAPAQPMSKSEELEMLRAESEEVSHTLETIRKRMESLEKSED